MRPTHVSNYADNVKNSLRYCESDQLLPQTRISAVLMFVRVGLRSEIHSLSRVELSVVKHKTTQSSS